MPAALLQHVKNGNPGSALRLAVVGISGNIILAQDIRINVVFSLSVFSFDRVDEIHGFLVGFHGSNITDEFRALFYEGGFCRLGNCIIIHKLYL